MNLVKVFGLLTLSIPLFVSFTRSFYFSKKQVEEQDSEEEEDFKEEEEEEEQEQEVALWAELDSNLLGEILSRLSVTDEARFRAVCKNWLVAPNTNTKSSSLPWYGCKIPGQSEYRIYDPFSSPNQLASRHCIHWSQLGIPSYTTIILLNIQHNWLFISNNKSRLFFWTRRYVILFSPLTKKIITLPKFDYPRSFDFGATSSTHPDSPDCVFFMVAAKKHVFFSKIAVLTCRNGDKEWTVRQFNSHYDFYPCLLSPSILDGILYIMNPLGQVASYNILNGKLIFDRLLPDEFVVQNSSSKYMKSFVLNGELMILCYNPDVKNDATPTGQQFVRRYDRSLKVWIPVTTLADHTLFFGNKFMMSLVINTKDRTCSGVLSNKIYRFLDGGCIVYSLEDGELVRFKSINSNVLEDGGDHLPEYKYNYGIPDKRLAYWLEAPHVRSSSYNEEVRSCRDEGQQGTVRALGLQTRIS